MKHALSDQEEMKFEDGTVALVSMANDDDDDDVFGVPFSPQKVFIVLEDHIVMSLNKWTDALVCLFGLIYALHLSYPQKCIVFFFLVYSVYAAQT